MADKHYFCEFGVGLDLLRSVAWDGNPCNVLWTMNRVNEAIWGSPPGPNDVQAPGTLALLPLGQIGLAALRRRLPG